MHFNCLLNLMFDEIFSSLGVLLNEIFRAFKNNWANVPCMVKSGTKRLPKLLGTVNRDIHPLSVPEVICLGLQKVKH